MDTSPNTLSGQKNLFSIRRNYTKNRLYEAAVFIRMMYYESVEDYNEQEAEIETLQIKLSNERKESRRLRKKLRDMQKAKA